MLDHSWRLVLGLVTAVLVLLVCTSSADALRYTGERIDIYTGQVRGRWIITTRETNGGATLATTVRCRPRRKCRPFPGRLALQLTRGSDTFSFGGTFSVGGATCVLDAYVYGMGFEGTYTCADGTQGSISGRR